jgi:hypothetical protein
MYTAIKKDQEVLFTLCLKNASGSSFSVAHKKSLCWRSGLQSPQGTHAAEVCTGRRRMSAVVPSACGLLVSGCKATLVLYQRSHSQAAPPVLPRCMHPCSMLLPASALLALCSTLIWLLAPLIWRPTEAICMLDARQGSQQHTRQRALARAWLPQHQHCW